MVAAGCRFFAGYPMTPFTEVLEGMAKHLPEVNGVCMNAESEIEAVGMAWGASAAGVRSATGSVGQGLSLMQESLAEICFAQLPLVVLNMARGQGDYFQATRGGGHGDYRHIVLAPSGIAEAVKLVQYAFHLADRWRNPVMFMGDYYLAHALEAIDPVRIEFGELPPKDWRLNGSTSGTGKARIVSPILADKRDDPGCRSYGQRLEEIGGRVAAMASGVEPLLESEHTDDAELVVVAYGTPARYVRYAVNKLRRQGLKVGYARPITLWPFPSDALVRVTARARAVVVYELNTGQMYDDVRIAVRHVPVRFIGGLSYDHDGFGIAPDLSVNKLEARVRKAFDA